MVLQNIPFFADFETWFFTHHLNTIWLAVYRDPIPWWNIGESLCVLLAYNVAFLTLGFVTFQVRDFK